MTIIQLGFKAFDPHELLCHFVAVEAGLYQSESLRTELIDITFTPEHELPEQVFQASCGAALSSALKGIPQRVLLVATDRPMFWLYSSDNIKDLNELSGKKIATFPTIAPPHHLANIILNKAGVEKPSLHPARDDMARLGLLKSANVDAAVISSAIAPPEIEQSGFNKLCFFGDKIRVPTTGLAIDQSFLEKEVALTQTLVDIHRKSLLLIHENISLVAAVLKKYFTVPETNASETAMLYQPCYTKDGRTTEDIAQSAINSMSKSLGVKDQQDWTQIYRFQP